MDTLSPEEDFLISVIKALLNGSERVAARDTGADPLKLVNIAARHKVEHLIYYAARMFPDEVSVPEDLANALRKKTVGILVLDARQREEKERVLGAFDKNGLYCIPLKGAVTKDYYPKSEWRTMADLDFLYRASQHKEVRRLLSSMGYTDFTSGLKHDIYADSRHMEIEMHRTPVPADSRFASYYGDVWEKSVKEWDRGFVRRMSLDEQYIYTMVHLYGHFADGGIGVRFVMDIYVFLLRGGMDEDYIHGVFERLDIAEFADNIKALALTWFGKTPPHLSPERQRLIGELGKFVMGGGLYGNSDTAVDLAAAREGKSGYLLRVLFPGYESMVSLYPWLDRKKYLLPFAWAVRIIRTLLFRKESVRKGVKTVKSGDAERGKRVLEFYRRCGAGD